jgi:hypothetical protein
MNAEQRDRVAVPLETWGRRVRPLVQSALVEHELPDIIVHVVSGTEFASGTGGGRHAGPTPTLGASTWPHVEYQPTSEGAGWSSARSEDLQDPCVPLDGLRQLGSGASNAMPGA